MEALNILTIIISTFFLVKNIKNILEKPIYIFYLIFFVFYVVPLYLDFFIAPCDYTYSSGYKGFYKSQNDFGSVLLYNIFVLYTQFVILKKFSNFNCEYIIQDIVNKHTYRYWLLLGGCIPILATILLLRNPAMLYSFSWRELGIYSTEGSYSTIERFTYVGISCFVILLFDKYRNKINIWRLISIIGIFSCVCIQGKRASLFYVFVIVAILFYLRFINRKLNFKKITILGIAGFCVYIISMGLFTYSIETKIERGYDPKRDDIMYTTTRIDMFRDDRMRLAIYSQLHEDINVLDYPCQTFIGNISFIVPINYVVSFFNINILPYQTYFTYALTSGSHSKDIKVTSTNSWMTTSFFAELFSNIGFIFGILLSPYLLLWFATIAFRRNNFVLRSLFIFSFVLLNLFDFSYIVILLEISFVAYYISRKKNENTFYRSAT